MRQSRIAYADYSSGDLNVCVGCTPVSPGCANCYARAIYERFGKDFSKVTYSEAKLKRLLTKRFPPPYKRPGSTRPLCFLCDMSDLFHPDVPADFITYAFEVMGHREDVDWLVLTKRPHRMVDVLFGGPAYYLGGGDYIPNIWLGVTVENQDAAENRLPVLLDNWQGIAFASCEPLLEALDIRPWLEARRYRARGVDWVICGAESGANRRVFDGIWATDLYEQCHDAGISYFYKQGSGPRPGMDAELPGIGVVQEWPQG